MPRPCCYPMVYRLKRSAACWDTPNIKDTQIYAKITNQKISKDMKFLSHKLADMEKDICSNI